MKELLQKLDACEEAMRWACEKSWEEIYNTCHRGDWLLWLFSKTNPDDLQLITLAKGHCANTVRHLMQDQRSIAAVDAAIAFGEGKIGRDELDAAFAAAYAAFAAAFAAADAADAAAAFAAAAFAAAAYAADAAAYAAADAAYAAFAAAAFAAAAFAAAAFATADAAYAAVAAKEENQQLTADTVRRYIPIEKFNIKF
jgi:hypothetical protein